MEGFDTATTSTDTNEKAQEQKQVNDDSRGARRRTHVSSTITTVHEQNAIDSSIDDCFKKKEANSQLASVNASTSSKSL